MKFQEIYKNKEYLHCYNSEGMDDYEFEEALDDVLALERIMKKLVELLMTN